jgi:hypothetical protein
MLAVLVSDSRAHLGLEQDNVMAAKMANSTIRTFRLVPVFFIPARLCSQFARRCSAYRGCVMFGGGCFAALQDLHQVQRSL